MSLTELINLMENEMSYQEDFINQIAPYVQVWRDFYGWGVASAIIAQACLESAYGRSKKAQSNNYFGLKYRDGRVTCNSGYIIDTSKEQLPDGTYITIKTKWYAFADMNTGVEGYFQFIDTGNYASAKTQTTPEGYLQALKDCGYATSKNYVQNNMKVIETYNLTKYDGGKPMYSNSPLVNYVDISPHNYGPRKSVDGITIHHMAGNLSVKTCGQVFHRKNASSNYGINGRDVGMYCEEKYGACTSSNKANDMRMITIEVANEICAPYWTISAESMDTLVTLCTDICKRNGIKKLVWSDNKSDRINHRNGANMTMHCDFASTTCPGPFLKQCMANIAMLVTQRLESEVTPTPASGYMLNGYNYSPVFDPVFYSNTYADLKFAFNDNAEALWNHFITFGMNEFRQASAEFNPQVYKDNYEDLRNAYGDDNPMYYWHYVAFGKNEGRSAV